MNTDAILTDATDEQLGMAVEENLFALFRAMSTLPGGELEETPHFSRHFTSPTNPFYKSIWKTNLPSDQVNSAINETIEWFKARQAPYFFWWTDPVHSL